MKLKELWNIASIDEVLVVHTDKDGHTIGEEVTSQISVYGEEKVEWVEARLETSSSYMDGTIQVSPCLRARVVIREE